MVSIPRLSVPTRNLLDKINAMGTFFSTRDLLISILVGHFCCKHSYLVEKNVSKAFILPIIWQDVAESLGIETASCLWKDLLTNITKDRLIRHLVHTIL